jgi:mitochondrial fission protein ELM1
MRADGDPVSTSSATEDSTIRREASSSAGMQSTKRNSTNERGAGERPLQGARCWLITDGKAGMDVQARGVADALGVAYERKLVEPTGIYKVMAPWGPVAARERFGEVHGRFGPPWPVIAIATGRASIPYIRALKRKAGFSTYTVVLQDPKSGPGTADLIWVPHSFSAERLAKLRETAPPAVAALPGPRVAVILGGKNGVYKFTENDDVRLAASIRSLAGLGASFMITPSRRTHQRLIAAVDSATAGAPRILWDGRGENPYPTFLAHADALIVTADSVNMTGEAAATGKPVYVFEPSAGSAKFRRFHETLRAYGATRPLPEAFEALGSWDYTPLDSAAIIAREIEARWMRRTHMLSGLLEGEA